MQEAGGDGMGHACWVHSTMPRLYSPGRCRGNMPAGQRSSSLWGVTHRCLEAKIPLRPWLLEGWAYMGGVAAGISLYATGAPTNDDRIACDECGHMTYTNNHILHIHLWRNTEPFTLSREP